MSRSRYSDDCDSAELNLWRGAVNRAVNGKRGQSFLREALATLDAMPVKELVADTLHEPVVGQFCTLGAVGAARGMDLKALEYSERDGVASGFGIAEALAAEVMYENDEGACCSRYIDGRWTYQPETPAERWSRMRAWIESNIKKDQP